MHGGPSLLVRLRPGRRDATVPRRLAVPQHPHHVDDRVDSTDVAVRDGERGKIEISFYSADDLERVLDLILGAKRERL